MQAMATFLGGKGIPVKYAIAQFYLHAKLIIADGVAFVGSENMSPTSLTQNREVGALVFEPDQARSSRRSSKPTGRSRRRRCENPDRRVAHGVVPYRPAHADYHLWNLSSETLHSHRSHGDVQLRPMLRPAPHPATERRAAQVLARRCTCNCPSRFHLWVRARGRSLSLSASGSTTRS